ncbi:hypothetical protein PHYSODRAFT_322746 [Phytophthora sojae]|uniref:Uncharacterized protein n=1 Tax=Phytophthora sojae (strain P6497) TaxID=1094619 RepID=G4YKQ4_PHYSP|nr:hypothetical protein PHYSODRAFT_322746 [Phytophthora sojae]EGZ29208.1 hypothetical protein PHYSODRAFT_322746 [Phytophthora sojae]|eukprot:XP_009516483.1 hypothetical protein PHYSODRAFT_322746 [Phytophthora sojae]
MAAARIKRELAAVDSTRDQESRIIPVCSATKDEWKAYLESDDQELRWFCEWINGMVYIVQLSGEEDESFADLPDYQPDVGYGPLNNALGTVLPRGIQSYKSWYTLVVEVGKSRGWGDEKGLLDWKARQWTRFPGVRYILCVAVTDRLQSVEYKLYTVERDSESNRARSLPIVDPLPVVGPHTVVTFDSRELLGLPSGANVPPIDGVQFPVPTYGVDLFGILSLLKDYFD